MVKPHRLLDDLYTETPVSPLQTKILNSNFENQSFTNKINPLTVHSCFEENKFTFTERCPSVKGETDVTLGVELFGSRDCVKKGRTVLLYDYHPG